MLHNDPQNGNLIVKSGYISPKIINRFVQTHMEEQMEAFSIKDKILFPKFVIKLASKSHTKNESRIYFSKESMIADLMSFWG